LFSIECTRGLRPHYLLGIDPERLIGVPEWAADHLRMSKCVVVRRGSEADHNIPVGVRGAQRNQRWATFCRPEWVRDVITPPQLLDHMAGDKPAFLALHVLKSRWGDWSFAWGPGGSVGFELATGIQVVKPESDLDIVVYADRPMTADEARALCDRAMNLAAPVDIRVETPVCGFSLREYARQSPAPILLRAPGGVLLGSDPWGR
jgi:phosphoribosyl-dephospho-CoA transferase